MNLNIVSKKDFDMEIWSKPFICLQIANYPVKHTWESFEFLKDLNLTDSCTKEETNLLIGSNFCWSLYTRKMKISKSR